MWTSKKPSLSHFDSWAPPAKVKIYDSNWKKTDQKSVSCILSDMLKKSKGYKLYHPTYEDT